MSAVGGLVIAIFMVITFMIERVTCRDQLGFMLELLVFGSSAGLIGSLVSLLALFWDPS